MTTSTLKAIATKNNFVTPASVGYQYRYKTKRKNNNKNRVCLTFKNLSQRGTVLQLEMPITDGVKSKNPMSWFKGRVVLENEQKYVIPSTTVNKLMKTINFKIIGETETDIIIRVI